MRDEIRAITPRLRRFARALVAGGSGARETADALVQATLMRAVGTGVNGSSAVLPIRLFATVTQLHRDLATAERSKVAAVVGGKVRAGSVAAPAPVDRLAAALQNLEVEEREALLLVALEQFDHATAARILRIPRPVFFERLTRARTALAASLGGPTAVQVPASTRVPYLRLVVG